MKNIFKKSHLDGKIVRVPAWNILCVSALRSKKQGSLFGQHLGKCLLCFHNVKAIFSLSQMWESQNDLH